jgi:TonB family protein
MLAAVPPESGRPASLRRGRSLASPAPAQLRKHRLPGFPFHPSAGEITVPDRYGQQWTRPRRQQPWRLLIWGLLLLVVAATSFVFRFELNSAARGLFALVPWRLGIAAPTDAETAAAAAADAEDAAGARRSAEARRGQTGGRSREPADATGFLAELPIPGKPRLSALPLLPPPPDLLTLPKPIPFPGEVVEAMLSSQVPPQSFPARLRNPDEVVDLVYRHYPPRLREAGFGGRVVLALVVDATGSVRQQRVAGPSNFTELNAAALEVGRRMEFSPARQLGRNVESRLMFPVVFRP